MHASTIPAGLPDSNVINALIRKTAALTSAPSRKPAYLEWLKALRDRIAPELSYTNITFPQFTPHDEPNHIHPLFVLTQRLLSPAVIDALNAGELFVLACSLYAHDWGMAVSDAEKQCLLGLADQTPTDAFSLLDSDKTAFAKLLEDYKLANCCNINDVPSHVWQSYIRETHAARSAQRVRAFFKDIDINLGDSVAMVSEGHNLDVERLRDFSASRAIQGETVNDRALAIFLRLIDLFDLSLDRTPLALWKFISPENVKSAEEWAKHRALSPVTVEQFQEVGHRIRVSGMTDDYRVYAALEDLREYCDSQLRLCNGLIDELPSRYHPRLLYLDWKVEPQGFEPIAIRFEFDRNAMIKILSDEIYDGDRYVFLRELLQNSIDAIRMRRALHLNKKTGITFDGAIRVNVEHLPNGCATISWTDNGCGMSSFIVRNYLTVAGKSFYRSQDFEKLGIPMDPISRFGVGLFSCFMVTDSLQISTRQDPQIIADTESLKIDVDNPQRYLRIQRCKSHEVLPVGTTVKVFVGRSASDKPLKIPPAKLNVTTYLRDIAGFVEFPIYVEEEGNRTLIIHPDHKASRNDLADWNVVSLDRSYPWENVYLPQDANVARESFVLRQIAMKPSESNGFCEGVFTYLELKDDIKIHSEYRRLGDSKSYVATRDKEIIGNFRMQRDSRQVQHELDTTKPRSSRCNNMCRIYCDGVLVAGASPPQWAEPLHDGISECRIVLNFCKSGPLKLDLSRREITESKAKWSDAILSRFVKTIQRKAAQIVKDQANSDSIYPLSRLVAYACAGRSALASAICDLDIPLLVINKNGDAEVVNSKKLSSTTLHVFPRRIAKEISKSIFKNWGSSDWLPPAVKYCNWHGSQSLCAEGIAEEHYSEYTIQAIENIQTTWLARTHELFEVRFLEPFRKMNPPLMQELWSVKNARQGSRKSAKRASLPKTVECLGRLAWSLAYHCPPIVKFHKPFERYFTAGWNYLNIEHPITQAFSECIAAIVQRQAANPLSKLDFGRLCDQLFAFVGDESPLVSKQYLSDAQIDIKLNVLRKTFELTSKLGIFELPANWNWPSEHHSVPIVVNVQSPGSLICSIGDT